MDHVGAVGRFHEKQLAHWERKIPCVARASISVLRTGRSGLAGVRSWSGVVEESQGVYPSAEAEEGTASPPEGKEEGTAVSPALFLGKSGESLCSPSREKREQASGKETQLQDDDGLYAPPPPECVSVSGRPRFVSKHVVADGGTSAPLVRALLAEDAVLFRAGNTINNSCAKSIKSIETKSPLFEQQLRRKVLSSPEKSIAQKGTSSLSRLCSLRGLEQVKGVEWLQRTERVLYALQFVAVGFLEGAPCMWRCATELFSLEVGEKSERLFPALVGLFGELLRAAYDLGTNENRGGSKETAGTKETGSSPAEPSPTEDSDQLADEKKTEEINRAAVIEHALAVAVETQLRLVCNLLYVGVLLKI